MQVVGVYVGLVDTDMAKFTDYPKSDPADVVRQVLGGIESGADEVLADKMTRVVRAQLNKPIRERLLMKAFTIDRYKSKDGGRIVDMPQPEVGDNDVLVQIHAAGVNLLDAKIADGGIQDLPAVPISTCSRQRRRRRCGQGGSTGAALQAR